MYRIRQGAGDGFLGSGVQVLKVYVNIDCWFYNARLCEDLFFTWNIPLPPINMKADPSSDTAANTTHLITYLKVPGFTVHVSLVLCPTYFTWFLHHCLMPILNSWSLICILMSFGWLHSITLTHTYCIFSCGNISVLYIHIVHLCKFFQEHK